MKIFKQQATCCECKKEFEVTFTSDDKGNLIDTTTCPNGCTRGFTTRFAVDESKWHGVWGTNGD